jgi:Mce-associated membrane protein
VREDREEDEQATTVLPAADETGPAEDSSEVEPAESEPLLRGRGLTGMVALLVVTVLLLAAAITAGVFWANGAAEQADRENALSAARQTAVNLTTIDFNRAEEDVRRVLDGSTGDFGGLFTQNIDSYVGVVKDGEVVTTGEVAEAGVEKYDGNTASAVVAVKTTVKNKTVPNGEQRFYRLVEQMEKHDGRWLVSRVEFVP